MGEGTTADFSVQSVVLPSTDYGGGWQWSGRPLADTPLAVSAVNTSETQHDSYQAFLSGILFGVAGGALVAIIQELVAPFRAREGAAASRARGLSLIAPAPYGVPSRVL